MKKIMVASLACLMLVGVEARAQPASGERVRLTERLAALESTLRSAIILTDRPCSEIGPNWRPFGPMSGRFPLAAGQGRDDREETVKFSLGSEGGEYRHMLSVEELPEHGHGYRDRSHGAPPSKVDHGDDRRQEHQDANRRTGLTGGDQPHNNMPPYWVVNFCRQN